jgi:hypothetical protein
LIIDPWSLDRKISTLADSAGLLPFVLPWVMTGRLSECVTTTPLCCGWLRSLPTSSSNKNVLNVPQRARLRAFLFCILVGGDLAQPRDEVHCCYALEASLHLRAVPTVTSVGEILWNCQSHCVLMRGGKAASFRFSERAGL